MPFWKQRGELPGLEGAQLPPDVPAGQAWEGPIGPKQVQQALETLVRYKQGKTHLEERIVQDELWWELRHWEAIRRGKGNGPATPQPTSAWLFNAITNKHADAMDNFPEPLVLPREPSDRKSAQVLSAVLPVVLEQNEFEQTYSDNWWEKLKHGTAAYGVFWNSRKENGLGDIDIRQIDLLKLFWEPGITHLQHSRNLFLVELVDEDLLNQHYPQYQGRLKGKSVDVKQYLYDDSVDLSGKAVVVDWYYKVPAPDGRTLLHYAKLVGETLLFASENLPEYRQRGWYDHGQYPVVLDVLFPEKGTPVGFGYVAVCKDPQLYIDQLSANILENAMMTTKKRFFVSNSTAINEEEFLDWSKPLVHVEGELDERRIQEMVTQPLASIYPNLLQMKIEEMKETAANRDVNSGSAGAGVTAASAIAALQEAGSKSSRDMISASYRAYTAMVQLCVELIRQFYEEARSFRVVGAGAEGFVTLDNAALRDQPLPPAYPGQETGLRLRRPVFDIRIQAQKQSPFSRMEQNERAKELYGLGFFQPQRAQEALGALEMMEFEGVERVREQVRQGQTLEQTCQALSRQVEELAALVRAQAGRQGTGEGQSAPATPARQEERTTSGGGIAAQAVRAHTPKQSYSANLVRRDG